MLRRPPRSTLSPYTTRFRSRHARGRGRLAARLSADGVAGLRRPVAARRRRAAAARLPAAPPHAAGARTRAARSEEHTSELQSRQYLVCRLLLEKKNISPLTF